MSKSKVYPKVFFATYDTSMHIIPFTSYLWNKYYKRQKKVVLGYKVPEWANSIKDTEFVSLKEKRKSFKEWSSNLGQYLAADMDDEYVFFTVDDMVLFDDMNYKLLDAALDYMDKNKGVICCYGSTTNRMGMDVRKWEGSDKIVEETDDYFIFEANHNRHHLVNLQINLWRRKQLCQILNNKFDITDFEVKGSNQMRKTKCRFIGIEDKTKDIYSRGMCPNVYFTLMSGRRNPDKISVLGLKNKDVADAIEEGILDKRLLVYGYDKSYSIPYDRFDGKFDFKKYEKMLRSQNKIKPNGQLGNVVDSFTRFKREMSSLYE